MAPDLHARRPDTNAPQAVRAAAARAGRRNRPVDLLLLRRVRDALARLPDSALNRRYLEIPGDSLASPRVPGDLTPTQGRAMTGQPPHRDRDYRPRCACGLVVRRSWDLVGHFLAVYPPHASQPLDDFRHADVTRLSVKLSEGPTEVWEIGTWARDPRKHMRVAASIAMRSATGDLEPWATVTQRDLAQGYRVPARVARNAIAELMAAGILGRFGEGCNVMDRDLVERRNAALRAERILGLVTHHVTMLEAVVSQRGASGPVGTSG